MARSCARHRRVSESRRCGQSPMPGWKNEFCFCETRFVARRQSADGESDDASSFGGVRDARKIWVLRFRLRRLFSKHWNLRVDESQRVWISDESFQTAESVPFSISAATGRQPSGANLLLDVSVIFRQLDFLVVDLLIGAYVWATMWEAGSFAYRIRRIYYEHCCRRREKDEAEPARAT